MAESDFSWIKILSFFGAAILAFTGFVTLSTGISIIIHGGEMLNGFFTCLGAVATFALAVIVYLHYEHRKR